MQKMALGKRLFFLKGCHLPQVHPPITPMKKFTSRHAPANEPDQAHGTAVHGFTLMELLVVIVIVAVLAALGLGALQRAKSSANEFKSLAVLRTVCEASIRYSGENNGQINTLRWDGDQFEGSPKWAGDTFWGRQQPYLFPGIDATDQRQLQEQMKTQLARLFGTTDLTKMDGTPFAGAKIYGDVSGIALPFAFNTNLYVYNKWVLRQGVERPSMTAYLTYGWATFDTADGQTYQKMPMAGEPVSSKIYYLPSEKALMGFLDGHVERIGPPIAKEMIEISANAQ